MIFLSTKGSAFRNLIIAALLASLWGCKAILEDYEAKILPIKNSHVTGKGKVEWERYGSGEVEFELKLKKLNIPDGTSLEVHLNGRHLGSAEVQSSRAVFLLVNVRGDVVPRIRSGDLLEVHKDGVAVMSGEFDLD